MGQRSGHHAVHNDPMISQALRDDKPFILLNGTRYNLVVDLYIKLYHAPATLSLLTLTINNLKLILISNACYTRKSICDEVRLLNPKCIF